MPSITLTLDMGYMTTCGLVHQMTGGGGGGYDYMWIGTPNDGGRGGVRSTAMFRPLLMVCCALVTDALVAGNTAAQAQGCLPSGTDAPPALKPI